MRHEKTQETGEGETMTTACISSDKIKKKGIVSDIASKLKKKPISPFEGSVMQTRQKAGMHMDRTTPEKVKKLMHEQELKDILSTTQEFNAAHGIKSVDESMVMEKGIVSSFKEQFPKTLGEAKRNFVKSAKEETPTS